MAKIGKRGVHWNEIFYAILTVTVLTIVLIIVIFKFFPGVAEAFKKIKEPLGEGAKQTGELLRTNLLKGLPLGEKDLRSIFDNTPKCSSGDNKELIDIYRRGLERARALSSTSIEKQSLILGFQSELLNCCKLQSDIKCILSVNKDPNVVGNILFEIGRNPIHTNDAIEALKQIKLDKKVEELNKLKDQFSSIRDELSKVLTGYKTASKPREYQNLLSNQIFNKNLKDEAETFVKSLKASIEINKISSEFKEDCNKLQEDFKKYEKQSNLYLVDKNNGAINKNKPINLVAIERVADLCGRVNPIFYENYFRLLNTKFFSGQEESIIKEKIKNACSRFSESTCRISIKTKICVSDYKRQFIILGIPEFNECKQCSNVKINCGDILVPDLCNNDPCNLDCNWDDAAEKCRG